MTFGKSDYDLQPTKVFIIAGLTVAPYVSCTLFSIGYGLTDYCSTLIFKTNFRFLIYIIGGQTQLLFPAIINTCPLGAILMKLFAITLLGLVLLCSFVSFNQQDKVGEIAFKQNCSQCHEPNKMTSLAPSFQNIRKDYGLEWTISFVRNNSFMRESKDIRTLYSYYMFNKIAHISFPGFERKYIIKILDYVDSYPIDTTQYKHRNVDITEKKKFVKLELLKDTVKKSYKLDTTFHQENVLDDVDSTTTREQGNKRRTSRRGVKNDNNDH